MSLRKPFLDSRNAERRMIASVFDITEKQILELSHILQTHPQQARFKYELVDAISKIQSYQLTDMYLSSIQHLNANEKAEVKSPSIELIEDGDEIADAPQEEPVPQVINFYRKEFLEKYNLTEPDAEVAHTELLHADKIQGLIDNWKTICTVVRENDIPEYARAKRLTSADSLFCLKIFNPQFVELLLNTPLEHADNIQRALTDLASKSGSLFGEPFVATEDDIALVFADVTKAKNTVQAIKWLHDKEILTADNRKKISAGSAKQLERMCQLSMVLGPKSNEDKQILAQAIVDKLSALTTNADIQNLRQSFNVPLSEDKTLIPVRIERTHLQQILAFHQSLEDIYNKSDEREQKPNPVLLSLQELAKSDAEYITELNPGQLFELSWLTTRADNPVKRAEFKDQIFAIKKAAQDSKLASAMFGEERANYLKELWRIPGKMSPVSNILVFLIDLKHLAKLDYALHYLNLRGPFLGLHPWRERYSISLELLKILVPFLEESDEHTFKNVCLALDWIAQLGIATSEKILDVKNNPSGMGLLASLHFDVKALTYEEVQLFAFQVYDIVLPLVVARQNRPPVAVKEKSLPSNGGTLPETLLTPAPTLASALPKDALKLLPGYYGIIKPVLEYDEIVSREINIFDEKTNELKHTISEAALSYNYSFLSITSKFVFYLSFLGEEGDIYQEKEVRNLKLWNAEAAKNRLVISSPSQQQGIYKVIDENHVAYYYEGKLSIYNLENNNEEVIWDYKIEGQTCCSPGMDIVGKFREGLLTQTPQGLVFFNKEGNISFNRKGQVEVRILNDESVVYAEVRRNTALMSSFNRTEVAAGETDIQLIKFDSEKQNFVKSNKWRVPQQVKNMHTTRDGILLYQDLGQVYALDLMQQNSSPISIWTHPKPCRAEPYMSISIEADVLHVKPDFLSGKGSLLYAYDLNNLRHILRTAASATWLIPLSLATNPVSMWGAKNNVPQVVDKLFCEERQTKKGP